MGLSQQQGRGSGIDPMTDFDHMLVFALATRVSSNGASIFKIDLDLFEGFSWRQGTPFALRWIQNTSRFAQDLPDGARGTWRANAQSLQGSIALQEIQDGGCRQEHAASCQVAFHVSREYVQPDEDVVEVGAYDEPESANVGPANHRLWLDVAVVSIFSPNQPSDQWQERSLRWSILGAAAAGSARPHAHRSS